MALQTDPFVLNTSTETQELVAEILRLAEPILRKWSVNDWDLGRLEVTPLLKELHSLGVFSIAVPEDEGGAGGGLRESFSVCRRLAFFDPGLGLIFADHALCCQSASSIENDAERLTLFSTITDQSNIWSNGFPLKGLGPRMRLKSPITVSWPSDSVWEHAKGPWLAWRGMEVEIGTFAEEHSGVRLQPDRCAYFLLMGICLGQMERSLFSSREYVRHRVQFRKSLDRNARIKDLIVQMEILVSAAESLGYLVPRIPWKQPEGAGSLLPALFWCLQRWAQFCAGTDMQLCGGNGFMEDTGIPHGYRSVCSLGAWNEFSESESLRVFPSLIASALQPDGVIGKTLENDPASWTLRSETILSLCRRNQDSRDFQRAEMSWELVERALLLSLSGVATAFREAGLQYNDFLTHPRVKDFLTKRLENSLRFFADLG